MSEATRRGLASRGTADAGYDAMIAAELGRGSVRDGRPAIEERFPPRLDLASSVWRSALRRNPPRGAMYVLPNADRLSGPLATGAAPLQARRSLHPTC